MKNYYEIRGEVTAIIINRKDGEIFEALVDTNELTRLRGFDCKWYATWDRKANTFYVKGEYLDNSNKRRSVYLHRFITGAPIGLDVDHFDHDTFNNRLKNLRIVSTFQNSQNRVLPITNTSGVRGVSWKKREKKWAAQIEIKGKAIWLGYHENLEDAARVVNNTRARLLPYSQEAAGGGFDPDIGTNVGA